MHNLLNQLVKNECKMCFLLPRVPKGGGTRLPLKAHVCTVYVCSSTGVDFGLQTRQCLAYWSHNYTMVR